MRRAPSRRLLCLLIPTVLNSLALLSGSSGGARASQLPVHVAGPRLLCAPAMAVVASAGATNASTKLKGGTLGTQLSADTNVLATMRRASALLEHHGNTIITTQRTYNELIQASPTALNDLITCRLRDSDSLMRKAWGQALVALLEFERLASPLPLGPAAPSPVIDPAPVDLPGAVAPPGPNDKLLLHVDTLPLETPRPYSVAGVLHYCRTTLSSVCCNRGPRFYGLLVLVAMVLGRPELLVQIFALPLRIVPWIGDRSLARILMQTAVEFDYLTGNIFQLASFFATQSSDDPASGTAPPTAAAPQPWVFAGLVGLGVWLVKGNGAAAPP